MKKELVNGLLCHIHPFPSFELFAGLVNYFVPVPRDPTLNGIRLQIADKYSDNWIGVKLAFNKARDWWWLYYPDGHATGHFDSRREAIEWFVNAGR